MDTNESTNTPVPAEADMSGTVMRRKIQFSPGTLTCFKLWTIQKNGEKVKRKQRSRKVCYCEHDLSFSAGLARFHSLHMHTCAHTHCATVLIRRFH